MNPNIAPRPCSRRQFLYQLCGNLGFASLSLQGLTAFSSCGGGGGGSEAEAQERMGREQGAQKLGIALVGLGRYSSGQLAPALQQTEHCYLAGIVTGTPEKAEKWKGQYKIPQGNIYDYASFDDIKNNKDIDIVYVVLPNALHAEYVVRAARAGKHVICEKPMAVTVEDCDRMIAACREAGKRLSIGYRLHFEPHNREMMRLGREKVFGALHKLQAENGFPGAEGWRLNKALAGGGPLMDVGIYCVQGARYTSGMEPIAVRAQQGPKTDQEKFREVEESVSWQMEFPGKLVAHCKTSYAERMNLLRAEAEKGWFELAPAFPYSGIRGRSSAGDMNFPQVNQQALQMDDFAQAVKTGRPTPVPGEMGRQDVKILQAIYKAMETGQRVEIV